MIYSEGLHAVMSAGRIHRITIFAPGYHLHDRIQVATLLAEVFEVLGPPARTRDDVGSTDASRVGEDGTLYRDIHGAIGNCLHRNQAHAVAPHFADNRVWSIMLLSKER